MRTLICNNCGRTFSGKLNHGKPPRFCSVDCYRSTGIDRTCEACGNPFTTTPSLIKRNKGKVCSVACSATVKSRRAGTLADRIARRVIRQDGCWGWRGSLDSYGYGSIPRPGFPNLRLKAHRVAWAVATGEMPGEDIDILHTCDNRSCTRNDEQGTYEIDGRSLPRWGHLFAGTALDNLQDMAAKGRQRFQINPSSIKRGREQSQARLTEDDVRAIRRMAASGTSTMGQIAADFGVSRSLVYAVRKRKSWAHVAD